jgi:hypothetical protein
MVEMNPEFVYRMCVPDEHYAKIKDALKDAGRIGIYLTDKNGKRVRFYKIEGVIYADERKEDDSVFTQEVIKMSDIQKVSNEDNAFKNEMIKRLETDHPDMSAEEKDAYADILKEANESIKKLIASGIEPTVAYKIIESILQDKEVIDNTTKEGGSAEALAEVLRDRERMFGNPKDPNYGKDKNEIVEAFVGSSEKIERLSAEEVGGVPAFTEGVPLV